MAKCLYGRTVDDQPICKWCGRTPAEHSDEREKECAKEFERLFGHAPSVEMPPPRKEEWRR